MPYKILTMTPAQIRTLERERAVLVFIQRWYAEHGDPPHVDNVIGGVASASRNNIWATLSSLERQGLISKYEQLHWFPVLADRAWVNGCEYVVSPW